MILCTIFFGLYSFIIYSDSNIWKYFCLTLQSDESECTYTYWFSNILLPNVDTNHKATIRGIKIAYNYGNRSNNREEISILIWIKEIM